MSVIVLSEVRRAHGLDTAPIDRRYEGHGALTAAPALWPGRWSAHALALAAAHPMLFDGLNAEDVRDVLDAMASRLPPPPSPTAERAAKRVGKRAAAATKGAK